MYRIYHFLFWGVVWFFCPRQIWSPSSVSSVENDKRLVILEMDGPQFENSVEVWTFFFLHTTFSMKETLCIDIVVRVGNKLVLILSTLFHVCAGAWYLWSYLWSDVKHTGWRSQGALLQTCCFREDTWGVYAQGASASGTSGVLAAGYPGSDIHFEKVLIWPLYQGFLPLTSFYCLCEREF